MSGTDNYISMIGTEFRALAIHSVLPQTMEKMRSNGASDYRRMTVKAEAVSRQIAGNKSHRGQERGWIDERPAC